MNKIKCDRCAKEIDIETTSHYVEGRRIDKRNHYCSRHCVHPAVLFEPTISENTGLNSAKQIQRGLIPNPFVNS